MTTEDLDAEIAELTRSYAEKDKGEPNRGSPLSFSA